MPTTRHGYLLGIGSNLSPHTNFPAILSALLEHFEQFSISRIWQLPPFDMPSSNDFFNAVIFIETNLTESELKAICNAIEVQLGRDRTDPARKAKDRPADLDIFTQLKLPEDGQYPAKHFTDEYFIYPLIEELIAYLLKRAYPKKLPQGLTITLPKLSFGETATTIHRNGNTR